MERKRGWVSGLWLLAAFSFVTCIEWWKHSLYWSVCTVQEMEDEFLDAAESGNLPEVKWLMAKGCPANTKNEVKSTPLSVYIQTLSSSMLP